MILKLFKRIILKKIEKLIGIYGTWEDNGIITYQDDDGRGTSMTIKEFKKQLK